MALYRLVGGPYDGQRRELSGGLGRIIMLADFEPGPSDAGDRALVYAYYECVRDNDHPAGEPYYTYRGAEHPGTRQEPSH